MLLALQAFRDLSGFLTAKLASISAFRAAQQDWAAQLEALHTTPATSEACEMQVQHLQRSSRLLMEQVQQIQVCVLYGIKGAYVHCMCC
jgi:hypothetical protein